MKFIKFLILKLLFFTFTFLSPNSQNHTIFLYGSVNGDYNKKDMQFLYKNIATGMEENGDTVKFWPQIKTKKSWFKQKKLKGFCNPREINSVYKSLVTNVYYKILENQIIEHYEETNKPINIVAIGDGIIVLKNLLQLFSESDSESDMEYNYIGKVIIIGNKGSFNKNRGLEEETSEELDSTIAQVDAQDYLELLEQEKEESCCTTCCTNCTTCCINCVNWFTAEKMEILFSIAMTVISLLNQQQ